ncbi:MAG: hypothetical protein IJ486_01245 [Firmicutes bacterium]|nr:hypothetical protein [Bacillota bacterium]
MKRYRNRLFLAIASLLICVGVCLGGCGNAEEGETPDDSVIVNEQDGGQENDIVTNINEDALAEKLGVDGVTIIDVYGEASEKEKKLAVAVTVDRPGEGVDVSNPGIVTYDIYDLAEGEPGPGKEPMQRIVVHEYYFSDEAPCHVEDYNFDGAKDFHLWLWAGAQNSEGRFFLWNETAGQFVESEALGRLTSPMAREELGVILEHTHISGAEYEDQLYRWEGDALVLVRKIVQRMPGADALQGEVYDWYDGNWEPMYERKILLSEGEWGQEDYDKLEDLSRELELYYDPEYYGL